MNKRRASRNIASQKKLLVIMAVGLSLVIAGYLYKSMKAPKLSVISVEDVGAVGMPENVTARDGGISANVGGRLTWVFGDTFYRPTKPLPQGDFRPVSATAGVAPPDNPLALTGTADGYGVPDQLIPYNSDEPNLAPDDRYALWPASIITEPGGNTAMIYYQQTHITKAKWIDGYTSVAQIKPGETVANRLPVRLFEPGEPSFRKPVVVGDTVYLYDACADTCKVAKVSTDKMADRASYTFWDGRTWSSDITKAKKVLPGAGGGFSVAYSEALNSFVEVAIGFGSHTFYMRTASKPEGPWSSPKKVYEADSQHSAYVPNFQPELFEDNGRVLAFSYSRDLGNFNGDIRLLKLELASK
jgi:hypothetical protein